MERLTEHFGRYIRIKGLSTIYSSEYRKTASLNNAIIKLNAYEDTMPLERVQELAQTEKDGRLVMLTPNAPLTLEELREMDGEPVWFETVYNDCIYECGWAIVSTEYERIAGNSTYFRFENFGSVWTAYRHKPEEETA